MKPYKVLKAIISETRAMMARGLSDAYIEKEIFSDELLETFSFPEDTEDLENFIRSTYNLLKPKT